MIAFQMVWLATCILVASYMGFLVALNEFSRLRIFLDGAIGRGGMLGLCALLHAASAIILIAWISIEAAIISMSLIAFVWATLSYFLFQRFAHPLEKPGIARATPSVLPFLSFGYFVSSAVSLTMFAGWYWALAPVVIWLALGVVAAEHMIRRAMARGCDRSLAILGINTAQGRRGFFDMDRYPFP